MLLIPESNTRITRLCLPSNLWNLKESGCKSVWPAHILPLFLSIGQLLVFKIVTI